MTSIDQIRLEQQAAAHAPRKPHQGLVQFISGLFHPLLTLTYVALVICLFTPVVGAPLAVKLFFVGIVFFYTMFLPALIITLMHVFHIVGHWALRDRRDRMLPFFTNFVCYLVNALVLRHYNAFPDWIMMAYYGSVVLTFVAWIVSFWWKISAHASANAAGATYFLLLGFYFPDQMPLWLVLGSIVAVGAVCSTRIYLGRHTLAQVSCGVLLGILSMLTALNF